MSKYSDPTLQAKTFENLPVDAFNKITWRSGDESLETLLSTDPGRYLGEFRSMVDMPANANREAVTFPVLPWKVVTRRAGRETYKRYSATEMLFRPITARLKFVFYQRDAKGNKVKDPATNRDIILGVTKKFEKGSGYTPLKEVFGYVFNEKGEFATYGLLVLDGWSSYISYDKAAREFEKITVPDDKLVVYRIGTRGAADKDGNVIPKIRTFNGGDSVDIEAFTENPMMITADQNFDDMWHLAQTWANCPSWNAEKNPAGKKPAPSLSPIEFPEEPAYVDDGEIPGYAVDEQ